MSDIAIGAFTYDGLLAEHHRLPARHLGPALIGLDKIVSSLFRMLETKTVQKKKPKDSTLILTVSEPKAGSYDLPWIAQITPAMLPLWPDFAKAIQTNLVENFVNYVMLWFGGRKKEAEKSMDKMIDLLSSERDRLYDDRHKEREAIFADQKDQREHTRQLLHDQAIQLHSAAKAAVVPVGKSASSFSVQHKHSGGTFIDEATADAIREDEPVEVSDILNMTFHVEGLRDQRRSMYVYDPEDQLGKRIVPVVIADPAFEFPGNAYKKSYVDGSPITLTGKVTRYQDGSIKIFHAINGAI